VGVNPLDPRDTSSNRTAPAPAAKGAAPAKGKDGYGY